MSALAKGYVHWCYYNP
jgi:hypothetical protein